MRSLNCLKNQGFAIARHVVALAIGGAIAFGHFSLAAAEQNYSVTISGADETLTEKLEILSDLKKGLRAFPTLASLRRAAARDIDVFEAALQSAGYYDGSAGVEIVPGEGGAQTRINFQIDPGPQFRATAYDIRYQDPGVDRPASLADAGLTASESAAGAALRDLQVQFLEKLWESGYPRAEIVSRRAVADFDAAEARAVFVFNSGPKAAFGEPKISGAAKVDEDFIAKLKTWEIGAEYDRSKVIDYRDELSETGLFTAVDVAPGAPDANGKAPILVTVEERRRRTIGAGLSYSTTEGPGGRLFFANRNLFSRGELLNIEFTGSQVEQALDFDLTKPLPGLPGRAFAELRFTNETTDAFDARSLELSSGLAKNWLDDRLETRAALALETSDVTADGEQERTYFISTPLTVAWNSENDILNPTRGAAGLLTVTPYTGTDSFTQARISGRTQIQLGKEEQFSLATRAVMAGTFGSSLEDLRRNLRYYAGGGGSVRGYGFQEAGPLDEDSDPIGGRSLIEGAFEARAKVTQTIQLAGFIDAGSVSSNATPDFRERFFVGYGGGVRYFTPIGPIRVDIAFPHRARDSDRDFQLYIGLGQPF